MAASDGRLSFGDFKLARELDDQDGILARKAHEDHEADLREDVVVVLLVP